MTSSLRSLKTPRGDYETMKRRRKKADHKTMRDEKCWISLRYSNVKPVKVILKFIILLIQ